MKTMDKLSLILVSVLLMGACQEKYTEGPQNLLDAVIIADSYPQTKTQISQEQPGDYLDISWNPSDSIGVFGKDISNALFTNSLDAPSDQALFSGQISQGGQIQCAYYPYNPEASSLSSVPVSIQGSQKYEDGRSIAYNDIKASNQPITTLEGTRFAFNSLAAMLRISVNVGNFKGLPKGEELKSIKISAPQDRTLSGLFSLNLENLSLTPSSASPVVSLEAAVSPRLSDGADTLYAIIFPDIKKGDIIDIELLTSSYRFSFHKKAAMDFKAGAFYDLPINLGKVSSSEGFKVEALAGLPKFTGFRFRAAANVGSILDKQVYYSANSNTTQVKASEGVEMEIDSDGNVSGCIPYLYNFTLVPEFTLSDSDSRYQVRVGDNIVKSGETAVNFSSEVTIVVEDTITSASADYKVNISNTGLPVVVIKLNTPATAYANNWNYFLNTYIPSKTSDYGTADRIAIYQKNGVSDVVEMDCGVRHRGNFSMRFPKKAMNIKLSEKTKVLGMKKHKRWVLLANYNDRTMIRNALAFEIARRVATTSTDSTGLDWQPSGKFVELVFNGMHVGTYYLTEQIRQDKNRVAVSDEYEDRRDDYASGKSTEAPSYSNCGYILELDNNSTDVPSDYGVEEWFFRTSYCYEKKNTHIPVVSQNDYDSTTEGQAIWNQLKTFVNTADGYIYNNKYDKAAEMIDMTSASDYLLVMELTMNHEYMHPKSVYLHKDGPGKLYFGPVWDFDVWTFPSIPNINNMGRQDESYPNSYSKWTFTTETTAKYYFWYRHLLKQQSFVNLVKDRWAIIGSSPELAPESISSYVQTLADEISLSMKYNDEMWPRIYSSPPTGYQNGDEWRSNSQHTPYSFQESVDMLKSAYTSRYQSMSNMVNSLKTSTINR